MNSKLTRIVLIGFALIGQNFLRAQSDVDGKKNQSPISFNEYEQNKFSDIPADIEDIKQNMSDLEDFQRTEQKNLREFMSYSAQLVTPALKLEEWQVQRVKNAIETYKQNKENSSYQYLLDEFNNLVKYSFASYRDNYYEENINLELESFKNGLSEKRDSVEGLYLSGGINALFIRDFQTKDNIQKDDDQTLNSNINKVQVQLNRILKCDQNKLNSGYTEIYEKAKISLAEKRKEIEGRLVKIDEYLKKYKARKKEMNVDINEWGIKTGLPWYCGTVVFLFLLTVTNRGGYFSKSKDGSKSDENNQEHLSKVLLEVITVLLLTLTILILGLSNILKENVLGTLIGGIAAYILNRATNLQNGNTKVADKTTNSTSNIDNTTPK